MALPVRGSSISCGICSAHVSRDSFEGPCKDHFDAKCFMDLFCDFERKKSFKCKVCKEPLEWKKIGDCATNAGVFKKAQETAKAHLNKLGSSPEPSIRYREYPRTGVYREPYFIEENQKERKQKLT